MVKGFLILASRRGILEHLVRIGAGFEAIRSFAGKSGGRLGRAFEAPVEAPPVLLSASNRRHRDRMEERVQVV